MDFERIRCQWLTRSICRRRQFTIDAGLAATPNNLFGDVGVPFCRDKNCEAWRGEQRRNEIPRRGFALWPSHDARVGCHAQKLIEDRPSAVPSIRSRPLALEPVAAGGMKLRVGIGGVDQHIGIDGEH